VFVLSYASAIGASVSQPAVWRRRSSPSRASRRRHSSSAPPTNNATIGAGHDCLFSAFSLPLPLSLVTRQPARILTSLSQTLSKRVSPSLRILIAVQTLDDCVPQLSCMYNMAYPKLCLLIAFSFFAQSLQDDPVLDLWVVVNRGRNFLSLTRHSCRRWAHQTALVAGRLYIDGGEVAYKDLKYNYTSTLCQNLGR
jgi:hypothetical protein